MRLRRIDFFADVWDKLDLSEKKRLMSQVRKKHGNNFSDKELLTLLRQEYQNSINQSLDYDGLRN